jgi:riboflavin kinase/FMN adenylyltransferase
MLHTNWRDLPAEARGLVLGMGNFDGVHRGHAHLLHAAHAARPDARLGVLTFEPHPRALFRPDDPPFRLSPSAPRAALLAGLGVREVIEVHFDAAFAALTAEEFVVKVLHEALGAVHLACGADFAFGHRRGGNVAFLAARAEALGIGLSIVPQLADESGPISSSRIRRALQDGYPERAAVLLGRDWSIQGVVAQGDQRGRSIGFPTANIALGDYLEPARGVYAVRARLPDGRIVPGVANIGRRPTVADTHESRLEVHLFDFSGDLYGQTLDVALVGFLRPEQKFASFDALRQQILVDAADARNLLASSA